MRPDLHNLGPFRVHMSDPPWKTRDQLPGPGRGAAKKYPVMSTDSICSMATPAMYKDSVLLLWRIGCMVDDALRVARAWGFTPKAEFVWRKTEECGKCRGEGKRSVRGIVLTCEQCDGAGEYLHPGMGHHVMYGHEVCIIATRGANIRLVKDVRSIFSARMPSAKGEAIHSAKPPEFYDIIERMYPGPYVETFARSTRANWLALGNQVPEVLRGC